MRNKGHKHYLSMFKSRGKKEIIGCKMKCRNGKTFLSAVLCHNKFT